MQEPTEQEIEAILGGWKPNRIQDNQLKPAGVLVPIFRKDGQWNVLLTQRTDTVEVHKGEISFPGGHRDPEDRDLMQTALRETSEEVGIAPDQVKVLGRLDDIMTMTSYRISPFVGRIPSPSRLQTSVMEIEQVILLPLAAFMEPGACTRRDLMVQGKPYPVYYFNVQGHKVWGATAKILKQFLELCLGFVEPCPEQATAGHDRPAAAKDQG